MRDDHGDYRSGVPAPEQPTAPYFPPPAPDAPMSPVLRTGPDRTPRSTASLVLEVVPFLALALVVILVASR